MNPQWLEMVPEQKVNQTKDKKKPDRKLQRTSTTEGYGSTLSRSSQSPSTVGTVQERLYISKFKRRSRNNVRDIFNGDNNSSSKLYKINSSRSKDVRIMISAPNSFPELSPQGSVSSTVSSAFASVRGPKNDIVKE